MEINWEDDDQSSESEKGKRDGDDKSRRLLENRLVRWRGVGKWNEPRMALGNLVSLRRVSQVHAESARASGISTTAIEGEKMRKEENGGRNRNTDPIGLNSNSANLSLPHSIWVSSQAYHESAP